MKKSAERVDVGVREAAGWAAVAWTTDDGIGRLGVSLGALSVPYPRTG